jgi:hypothetical protein
MSSNVFLVIVEYADDWGAETFAYSTLHAAITAERRFKTECGSRGYAANVYWYEAPVDSADGLSRAVYQQEQGAAE